MYTGSIATQFGNKNNDVIHDQDSDLSLTYKNVQYSSNT